MQAIIFADRHGAELAPLCDPQCPALLPVANRPVLHYTIEDLADAGVTEMLIVVSDDVRQVRETFGDGARWGVDIRYHLSRGEERPEAVLARLRTMVVMPFLAARGDVLRVAACAEFLSACADRREPVVSATVGDDPIGLCRICEWPTSLPDLHWPPKGLDPAGSHRVRLSRPTFARLDAVVDYHRAVLHLAASDLFENGVGSPPGIVVEPGLRVDRLARVAAESRISGSAVVGAQAWVHTSARLSGPCVIGADCYIDRDTRLRNCVVLPGSYVGEGLQIENAVVAGATLVRVDLGTTIRLDDSGLLSGNGQTIGNRLRQWPERLVGGAMLAASLPLWPVALLAGALAAPRAPVHRVTLRSSRAGSHAAAWRFSAPAPLLRDLPLLWLVLSGDLRLFGARPLPAPTSHASARRGGEPAAGLLGPAQLYLPADAPTEEIELCEREFATDDRYITLLRRLGTAFRLLFRRRAWRRVPILGQAD